MADFTDLQLPSIMDTSTHNLVKDFFIPMLSHSLYYDRGVGFFSSGWLLLNCAGMLAFTNAGGKSRWVTSPILSTADWEALETGESARSDLVLRAAIEQNIQELLTHPEKDILSLLAWLVADEVVTFKLALPQHKLEQGDFHDKFGVFTDSKGNQISFNGSYNDSIQGIRNYESIKIFRSWETAFTPLVQADAVRFEKLWNNLDPNVRVFDLPEAAREQILQLRSGERPYNEPAWVKLKQQREQQSSFRASVDLDLPTTISLRDYQIEAIDAWFAHNCQGLLEMATGTGKTITALAASIRLYKQQQKRIALVITVPYQHLVTQWNEDAEKFGYQPVMAYQSKIKWLNELNRQILEYNLGHRSFIAVITTHTTFSSADFQNSILKINVPSLLIADEAHHLGAERSRQNYPNQIPFRLALSATPDRWFDDIGTETLRNYFGRTVFSFPLERAIGVSLTPYYYYPCLVPLTETELEEYQNLSLKIARLIGREDEDNQQALKILLMRRAELLNKAQNKIQVLGDLVDKQLEIKQTLFYCAPGQINDVTRLLGLEKGLLIHRFTAEEDNKERKELLEEFAEGNLQALVAMKCLDEGVDVPSTKTAYIVASSSNPREFIQRRGRVLRKAPGKDFSIIYDLIAVPPTTWLQTQNSPSFEAERNIIKRELQRFREFANPALNKHQAVDVIWDIAKRYGLLDALVNSNID